MFMFLYVGNNTKKGRKGGFLGFIFREKSGCNRKTTQKSNKNR